MPGKFVRIKKISQSYWNRKKAIKVDKFEKINGKTEREENVGNSRLI